ncbi:MAG: DUF1501 domain-containing protein [Planctomycetales bacterium]|nr:DUF1501 domain-containing protein [Planctomycetales bacterium]
MNTPQQLPHGWHAWHRRDLLRIGALSPLGLSAGWLVDNRAHCAEGGVAAKAKSCILLWLDGGPSHLETFDPKPDAPTEVRGPLESIATTVPGVRLSECLERTSRWMSRLAIIRSVTSPLGEHNFGAHYLMTGYKPTPVLEYPTHGAVLAHQREHGGVLPPYVAVPSFRVGGGRLNGGGFLPASTRPFSVGGDPSKPDFRVRDLDLPTGLDLNRLDRRQSFVEQLNDFHRADDEGPATGTVENGSDLTRAYALLSSADAKRAFRIDEESPAVRQQYGPRSIGASCLLARRLVERGVPFVTVNNVGWDTHADLYTRLKEGFTGAKVGVGLVPSLDLALSGLLQDLEDRGMLDETLVVVMGEFGRTPKLNTNGGRDHWPRVFSVAMAGGGVRGGQVIGSSDAVGESPADRPVTPADLAATIYTLLGIDPALELHTDDGRPVRATSADASVIKEVLA